MDDVENFGCLHSISTYPFENHLKDIKQRIQPTKTPIHQITRRLAEMFLDKRVEEINFGIKKLENNSWVPELKYKFEVLQKPAFK